jgi:hypothetical protein
MTITGRFAAITIAGEAIADSAVDILKVAYNELLRKRGDERSPCSTSSPSTKSGACPAV